MTIRPPGIHDEKAVKRWLILFYFKLTFFLFLVLLLVPILGNLQEMFLFAAMTLILLLITGMLIYKDYKNDPHGLLAFFQQVFTAWWNMNVKNSSYQRSVPFNRFTASYLQMDIEREVRIPKKVLELGGTYTVSVKLPGTCPKCDGSRTREEWGLLHDCPVCGGNGKISSSGSHGTFSLFANIQQPCSTCYGTGLVPNDPCPEHSSWYSFRHAITIERNGCSR
ncbi:MAG: zinc finger domain-containing protein [Candidatus Hodarchaeales archaeon]